MKAKKRGKPSGPINKSRKQVRKEKRKQKKARRNEYYTNRNKTGKVVPNSNNTKPDNAPTVRTDKNLTKSKNTQKILTAEEQQRKTLQKERKEHEKLKKEMAKQRKQQLQKANDDEDRNIKRLEKQLHLNKRKSKSTPKSFTEDGLDYLLEVCEADNMKAAVAAERHLTEINDDFEEDFALMTGKSPKKIKISNEDDLDDSDIDMEGDLNNSEEESDENEEEESNHSEGDIDFTDDDGDNEEGIEEAPKEIVTSTKDNKTQNKDQNVLKSGRKKIETSSSGSEDDINGTGDDTEVSEEEQGEMEFSDEEISKEVKVNKILRKDQNLVGSKRKKIESSSSISEDDIEDSDEKTSKEVVKTSKANKIQKKDQKVVGSKRKKISSSPNISEDENNDDAFDSSEDDTVDKDDHKEVWEDIYGRLRGKDGSIITENQGKYIPPAIRAKMEAGSSNDKKRTEKLNRLKRQLKGLLNRLAESNMHSIASQVEDLYMNNSRNDMNDTLTSLLFDSIITPILTPERLLLEHVMLVTILHANVGTEVGAHFLQSAARKFDELYKIEHPVENKMLDNVVWIIAQLYNYKVFHVQLIYEIINKLSNRFTEADIECILLILKSVGFSMRKDDPLALKNLIISLQKQANNASAEIRENPRVKFMLDILLAIKNNNMSKIPNYDTSYSEHLKKLLKGFIRKGSYVTTLNISLEDLLKADECGKWWVVGSAWTGKTTESDQGKNSSTKIEGFSQKLLDLARKQRMNTDTRRNVFCIIMSAEDYLDAFEKLLHLGLKNEQEREIVHVILHCCLQEKNFNPYYAVLAQKFCEYDRKFQMTIKYSVWDKLKALTECSASQLSNLAKLLTHLFLEKGLPISTLKIVQFGELDKTTLRFMRQILIGILLCEDLEVCQGVFINVAQSDKLKMFRESLKLFIQHFLLRNLKSEVVPEEQKKLLEDRAKMVDKILSIGDKKMRF